MLRRLTSTFPTWATVPLRLALGIVFIAHGSQKVLGKFGGPGWARWTSMSQLAPFPFMRPTWLWLAADAVAELGGGILILLGLFTRVGAFFIACAMLTAIIGIHWPNFFDANKGFEYPMTLLAGCLALLITGGGQASVDRWISRK
jgi:putative oxidoreductase